MGRCHCAPESTLRNTKCPPRTLHAAFSGRPSTQAAPRRTASPRATATAKARAVRTLLQSVALCVLQPGSRAASSSSSRLGRATGSHLHPTAPRAILGTPNRHRDRESPSTFAVIHRFAVQMRRRTISKLLISDETRDALAQERPAPPLCQTKDRSKQDFDTEDRGEYPDNDWQSQQRRESNFDLQIFDRNSSPQLIVCYQVEATNRRDFNHRPHWRRPRSHTQPNSTKPNNTVPRESALNHAVEIRPEHDKEGLREGCTFDQCRSGSPMPSSVIDKPSPSVPCLFEALPVARFGFPCASPTPVT